MEFPFLATELRKQLLWLTLACSSRKFNQKHYCKWYNKTVEFDVDWYVLSLYVHWHVWTIKAYINYCWQNIKEVNKPFYSTDKALHTLHCMVQFWGYITLSYKYIGHKSILVCNVQYYIGDVANN